MNLHMKELGVTLLFGITMLMGLLRGMNSIIAILATIVLLALTSSLLELRLASNSRDRYYLIGPAFYFLSGLLAISGLRHSPFSVLLFLAFILLCYGLLRSLAVRHEDPLSQLTLHQNIFLSTVWISLFLAILTLYNLLSQSGIWFTTFPFLALILVFLMTQCLYHYVRIAPWKVRGESLLAAWGIAQPLVVLSLWTVNPLMVAGSAFLLLYLFWGLIYHSHRKQLTRKVLYEYLLMSAVGLGFLLALTRFSASL